MPWQPTVLAVALCVLAAEAQALDSGPFSLTGFAKMEVVRGNNHCDECARFPEENKQRVWADEVVPGREYKTSYTHTFLFEPWFGAKFDLPSGFKLSGLLSQRWRDGRADIPGIWYERNIALSHEDYGSVRIGGMTTRAWSIADYPYGTNVGLADVWGSSGAGYGINTNAIRYTAPIIDLFEGDLVLEATHDRGNTKFKINKPRFWELYAQYHKGDLVLDAMYQDARNGQPAAWTHGPFTALTDSPADDAKLGGSGQSIGMVMGRYQVTSQLEASGGVRRNRWSGAYAVITEFHASGSLWNNMFNVDWNGRDKNGVASPGYAATSTDFFGGLRYRFGAYTASTGVAHLGKAKTDNPSERGQSNTATVNAYGLNYEYGGGLQLYGLAGLVHYGRLGLSPLSMPGNSAFTNVDSRVTRNGNWFGVGAVYVF
jgi:hypothetical protein